MLKDVPMAQKNPANAGQRIARGLETAARTLPVNSEGSVAENGRGCQANVRVVFPLPLSYNIFIQGETVMLHYPFPYQFYCILEVMYQHQNKKFYISELAEALHNSGIYKAEEIPPGLIEAFCGPYLFTIHPISLAENYLETNEIILQRKKYKKDAFSIGPEGVHLYLEYRSNRDAYKIGFLDAIHQNITHQEEQEKSWNNAWCERVTKCMHEFIEKEKTFEENEEQDVNTD